MINGIVSLPVKSYTKVKTKPPSQFNVPEPSILNLLFQDRSISILSTPYLATVGWYQYSSNSLNPDFVNSLFSYSRLVSVQF